MRLLYVALCVAGMVAFFILIRHLVTGISPDFGHGFTIGIGATIILIHLADRGLLLSLLRGRRAPEKKRGR